ncbi:MAG TPA: hypothetical protein VFU19_10260 [Iamia sp.]|nr:hypothetical protein [Iamia sp.]
MAAAARSPRRGRLGYAKQVASAVGVVGTVLTGTGAPVGATISHYGTTTSHGCTFNSAHHIFGTPGIVFGSTSWASEDPGCLRFVRVRFEYADYTQTFQANEYYIGREVVSSGFKSSLHSTRALDGTLVSRRLAAF